MLAKTHAAVRFTARPRHPRHRRDRWGANARCRSDCPPSPRSCPRLTVPRDQRVSTSSAGTFGQTRFHGRCVRLSQSTHGRQAAPSNKCRPAHPLGPPLVAGPLATATPAGRAEPVRGETGIGPARPARCLGGGRLASVLAYKPDHPLCGPDAVAALTHSLYPCTQVVQASHTTGLALCRFAWA